MGNTGCQIVFKSYNFGAPGSYQDILSDTCSQSPC